MNTVIQKWLERNEPKKKVNPLTVPMFKQAWVGLVAQKYPKSDNPMDDVYHLDIVAKTMCHHLYHETKGIIFGGDKGIGKSLNMSFYAKIARAFYYNSVESWEVTDFEQQYKIEGAEFMQRCAESDLLILNDIGDDALTNDYGTRRNLIADLLFMRYNQFQRYGRRTICTCNFTFESLKEMYGAKLADRFNEMFVFVELRGESKR